jgi:hypothetical protein
MRGGSVRVRNEENRRGRRVYRIDLQDSAEGVETFCSIVDIHHMIAGESSISYSDLVNFI